MMRLLLALAACLLLAASASAQATEPIPATTPEERMAQLVVQDLTGGEDHSIAVAIKHLPSGHAYYLNADTPMESASLLKLPILHEAYRQRHLGRISFDEHLQISARAVNLAFGQSGYPVGSAISVDEAIERMITISDNAPAIALLDRLGNWQVNQTMRELGLYATRVDDVSVTSAADTLAFFEMLARLGGVDSNSSEGMLRRLLRQEINDRLPLYLPEGTPVAHKTGDLPGVVNDAGIIYTPGGPILVVVLCDGASGPVRAGMAQLARDLYDLAAEGGFGRSDSPPFLWDPGLARQLLPLLEGWEGSACLAVKHLGSGQGFQFDADLAWPSEAAFEALRPEMNCWGLLGAVEEMVQGRGGEELESGRGGGAGAPGLLPGISPGGVEPYLVSEEDGYYEAAVLRSGGERYAIAVMGDSRPPALPSVYAALRDYFCDSFW